MRPQLTDATLQVLSACSVADLDTPEARTTMRQKLIAAYNATLGRALAEHIYFSEFVMQ
jgi:flagellar protein FliL